MGNKAQKVDEQREQDKIEWDHDMMKDLVIKKDSNGEREYLEATFAMSSKKDYDDWASKLKRNPASGS